MKFIAVPSHLLFFPTRRSSDLIAGCLWSVANTLTIFAIRDLGLSIAFPLWNTNALIGILWGVLFFGELKRSEEHTSELQSQFHIVCRLLLVKKKLISYRLYYCF